MRAAFRIALLVTRKDLRQRLRDRTAFLVAVIAPLGLAVIFSQLLAGATEFHATYVVADMDGGELARVLRQDVLGSLATAGVADISDVPTEAEARAAVEAGDADAAILVPVGFTAAIQGGQATTLEIVGAKNAGLATEIARSVGQRFGDGVVGVQLAVATTAELRGGQLSPTDQATIAAAAASAAVPVTLVDRAAGLHQLSWTTYFAAAMAILFLFFSAQIGMVSLFEERRQGTLARILAGPVRPTSILFGKLMGGFVMSLVAMTVLVLASTLMLNADWGPPVGVAAVIVAAIVAALGITTLVTSFAKSAEAAGAASAAVAITLGILGGTFSPTSQAPDLLATLALLTPHGWFLRGLGDMQGTGATPLDSLPSVGVLLAIGLVTGGLGFIRARRLVTPR
jgi:ABC-2 type transport system permease protein